MRGGEKVPTATGCQVLPSTQSERSRGRLAANGRHEQASAGLAKAFER